MEIQNMSNICKEVKVSLSKLSEAHRRAVAKYQLKNIEQKRIFAKETAQRRRDKQIPEDKIRSQEYSRIQYLKKKNTIGYKQ